ncbi:M81 family metallopeptidase [Mycolicibacterium litorale]|uniref:M81 family metallopeptidase n=1 Tax=Mycolicibacterium litorale TaxID=758802 RepID=UPI003CEE70F2
MKIVCTEFRQESNSLSPFQSDLAFWRNNGWVLRPEEMRGAHEGSGSAMAGMISEIERLLPDAHIVFGPGFYAQSGGTAAQHVMDSYTEQLVDVLRGAGDIDMILFSFHGALQTTEFDDAEAEVLRRVREVVGEDVVIGVSTDLHAYVSRAFAERADIISGYQTYPHVDFEETGRRAARLTIRKATDSAADTVMAWASIPMIVPASAYNSLEGPFADLIHHGHRMVADGTILDFSIYQMQPWLDVADPNSTVVVVAKDAETACARAGELAQLLYDARHAFTTELSSIDAVIDFALQADSAKPVILVDSADSNNAGAPGDSMAVAAKLLDREVMPRSATVVSDPVAVTRAHRLGVGTTAEFHIGGQMDPRAPQITAQGYIRSLHDGTFRPQVVGHTGDSVSVGRAAVVRFGNLDVMVCEHIAGNGDPQLYRAFGIDPAMYDLVVVKANTSFRAAYRDIAGTIVPTDTPGAASANVADLPFRRMPRSIYPWVDEERTICAEVVRG